MRGRAVLAAVLVLIPSAASACAGCVSSPYGDRTFGWAYLLLLMAPFFIACGIAGALAYGRGPDRRATARIWPALRIVRRRLWGGPTTAARGTSALRDVQDLDKETT